MAIALIVFIVILVFLLMMSLRTVAQGTVAVTTVFGKYKRTLRPGLTVVVPFVERIFRRISIQNRSIELQFQAITQDQANVYFSAMLLYRTFDDQEETIKNVAFKFISEKDLLTALVRSVEGSTRGFVAIKRQA
jgi:regulator of protease activity HflC (stomatin/prohibitin superfamily)